MAKRSLAASVSGQAKARQALDRSGWTQEQLALEVGLNTRQSVWKFLTGRAIDRHIFIDLCFQLNLDWQDIANFPLSTATAPLNPDPTDLGTTSDPPPLIPVGIDSKAMGGISGHRSGIISGESIEALVQMLRQNLRPQIESQCGVVQSALDMGRSFPLERLYTPARVLLGLNRQRWLEISDFEVAPLVDEGQRADYRVALVPSTEAVDALQLVRQFSKVMIFGKPGSGKTTFLKYLAQQCSVGAFQPDAIPVYLPLRHLLNFLSRCTALNPGGLDGRSPDQTIVNLEQYLVCQFDKFEITAEQVRTLLQAGRFLLLLDGLDEVLTAALKPLLREIQSFSQQYSKNTLIVTGRFSSQNYYFPGFTTVELDDWSWEQVERFVHQWFAANITHPDRAQGKAQKFLEAITSPENQPIRELGVTPILLSLICSVFLARSSFPKKRARLYQAGLDILLERWDQARGIERDQVYQHWSIADKLKLLTEIAAQMFEQGRYFFEKGEVLPIIAQFLRRTATSPGDLDPEHQQQTSEAVLNTIESQHGLIVERARDIYSFSHLTFQEYLTARQILYQTPEALEAIVEKLVSHTLDSNWHEVLRLSANMLSNPEPLLAGMLGQVKRLLLRNLDCHRLLEAIDRKVQSVESAHKPVALRAFYLTLAGSRDLRLATALDRSIAQNPVPELMLDLSLVRIHDAATALLRQADLKQRLNLQFVLEIDRKFSLKPALHHALEDLKQALPELDQSPETLQHWCETSGAAWLSQLQSMLMTHREIGHFWTLTGGQKSILHTYYQLNLLLLDCLTESQIHEEFQSQFEASLLLPS